LPNKVEVARGMKVLITNNIATDLDITNRVRGEIVDIILHPEDPPVVTEAIVHLKMLLRCVMVQLTRTRASHLDGPEESVVSMEHVLVDLAPSLSGLLTLFKHDANLTNAGP
jgi:hypothetical protein